MNNTSVLHPPTKRAKKLLEILGNCSYNYIYIYIYNVGDS